MNYTLGKVVQEESREIIQGNSLVDCKQHYDSITGHVLENAITEISNFVSANHKGNSLYYSLLLVKNLFYRGIISARLATFDNIQYFVYFVLEGQKYIFDTTKAFEENCSDCIFFLEEIRIRKKCTLTLFEVFTFYNQRMTLDRYLNEAAYFIQ